MREKSFLGGFYTHRIRGKVKEIGAKINKYKGEEMMTAHIFREANDLAHARLLIKKILRRRCSVWWRFARCKWMEAAKKSPRIPSILHGPVFPFIALRDRSECTRNSPILSSLIHFGLIFAQNGGYY